MAKKLSSQDRTEKFANLLYGVAFFNIFSKKELSDIVSKSDQIDMLDFQPGEKIFTQDEYDRNFFILMRGSVELRKESAEPEKKPFGSIKKGEVFGEMVITDPAQPRKASAYVSGKIPAVLAKVNAMLVENSPPDIKVKFLKKFLDLILDRINLDDRKLHYLQEIISFARKNGAPEDDEFFAYCLETAINARNNITQHIKYTDYLISSRIDPGKSDPFLLELLGTANKELDDSYPCT